MAAIINTPLSDILAIAFYNFIPLCNIMLKEFSTNKEIVHWIKFAIEIKFNRLCFKLK